MEVRITSAGIYILFPRLTCIGDGHCATCRHVARALDAPVLHGGPLASTREQAQGPLPASPTGGKDHATLAQAVADAQERRSRHFGAHSHI
jgi:hypothetical protein